MPRMSILNAEEKQAFDSPPVFNSVQRKQYFDVTPRIASTLDKLQSPTNQVCFLVTAGYFKATKRFFGRRFRDQDVEYVARQLGFLPELIEPDRYDEATFRRHQQFVSDLVGFQRWDGKSKRLVANEIRDMVRSQSRPKFIFDHAVGILEHRRIEIPRSFALSELILDEIKQHKRELTVTIDLTRTTRDFLEGLLVPSVDGSEGRLQKSRLALMKRISQSMKPSKIKVTVDDFRTLRELYHDVEPVINLLDITPEGIRYYAEAVLKSKVFQVSQRADDDRHLHLVCFATHQCFRIQDTLVDILLAAVQNTTGSCEREHKQLYYDGRNQHRQTVRGFLTRVDEGAFAPLAEIESIAFNDGLEDSYKVELIQDVLTTVKDKRDTATENLDGLRSQLERHAADAEYYRALEAKSLKLQNRVAEIVKVVEFHGPDGPLTQAIGHFKQKDGAVAQSAPAEFLEPDERKGLFDEQGKFRVSLYKALLFLRIADAVRAGSLNLKLSYKYRSLDDYLIPKDAWESNREDYLERSGLVQASDCAMTLDTLSATLHHQYEHTNRRILSGENEHVRFFKDGRFHVTTPKTKEDDSEPLGSLFPTGRYISLLEVLSSVNRLSGFLDAFEHWQTRYARARPANKTFFAGIIGIGCFIGTRKMEKISKAINGSELETTVNSYFSPENVDAANDQVLKLMTKLELPEVYRNAPGVLHTSSDGQKYEVAVDSLNANYSYKYHGNSKGVTAYSFLDERQFLWHDEVFSSAEKEAHYVIDGLMHNDVVKSDIHSTDTDGYSEVVFGVTHLLGFSFAPRLKNLKAKSIYSFREHPRKSYEEQGFKILPTKYINVHLIKKHWDDILRFVATIKLKHATASQLFKRLNSYSKQHPLYAALKEYGRIPKSDFILRYTDMLEFRQAIEKQLNKLENSNKFSKAVTFGNNQEFLHGEKMEQKIAEGCKRLIKNCIMCWNYLYLTQLIANETDSKRGGELLEMVRRGSIAAWKHVNLHGEYDFTDEKMEDSVGLETPKIPELSLV